MGYRAAGSQPELELESQTVPNVAAMHVSEQLGSDKSAARHTLELVQQHAWSSRMTTSRQSQWRAWLRYFHESPLSPLPVTEGHLLGFFVWLKQERELGRCNVGATSVMQYLTAVRQMHQMSVGSTLPKYPFVDIVLRGYTKWEEERFPKETVRVGLSATTMMRVYNFGMQTTELTQLRDCAALLFAYLFNSLRESFCMSIQTRTVSITPESLQTRVTICKGRRASSEQLLAIRRSEHVASSTGAIERRFRLRSNHPHFFALKDDVDDWEKQSLTNATTRVLGVLQISPPPGGKHTSYSLRIGSHTEQVLVGTPLEVRMAWFGWKQTSDAMPSLFFDRTIELSDASYWFFGRHNTPPASDSLPFAPSSTPPRSAA